MAKLLHLLFLLLTIFAPAWGDGVKGGPPRSLGSPKTKVKSSWKTNSMKKKKKKKCKSDKCVTGYYKKKSPMYRYRWRPRHHYDDHGHHKTASPVTPPGIPPITPPTRSPIQSPKITSTPILSPVTMAPVTMAPVTMAPTNSAPVISVTSQSPTSSPSVVGRDFNVTVVSSIPTVSPVNTNETSVSNATETGASVEDQTLPPTASPVAAINLRPPQKVTTTTSSPTVNPTEKIVQSLETRSMQSETLSFRASGSTDLGAVEVVFFEEVERLLAPFAASQIGPMLTKFLLSLLFDHDKLEIVSIGLTGQNTLYRSVFHISCRFDLEGALEDVTAFNQRDATLTMNNLFEGQMLNRLLLALSNRGIRISNISKYDTNNEPPSEDNNGETVGIPGDPTNPNSPEPQDSNPRKTDDTNRSALLISLFAGGLVILALGVAMLMNNRRRRRFYRYGEKVGTRNGTNFSAGGSHADPTSSELSQGSRKMENKIPVAALATKSYNSRDFLRRDATMTSGLEPMLDDIENHYSYYDEPLTYDEEKTEVEALDPSIEALPPSSDADFVAGTTLTALDGIGSVGEMNNSYPEFEMFVGLQQPMSPQTVYDIPPPSPPGRHMQQNSPTSPYWSVDGGISSGADDEEYMNDRRRWQDEANDIGLAASQDHAEVSHSDECSFASGSESENGWSDEAESEEGRKVHVLPCLD